MAVIRCFDIIASLLGLIVCFPIMVCVFIICFLTTGYPLFFQRRLGFKKGVFTLIKFRTMSRHAPSVPSHDVELSHITVAGSFLRRTKLDELPQLWNVLVGEMSLVGPRPCMLQQEEVILERDKRGVFDVRPGLTGLAQVNNIDMSTPSRLAAADAEMIRTLNLTAYFKYILLTLCGK